MTSVAALFTDNEFICVKPETMLPASADRCQTLVYDKKDSKSFKFHRKWYYFK